MVVNMKKIKNKLIHIFAKVYKTDEYNAFLLLIDIFLMVVNLFMKNPIIEAIECLLIVYILFRFFSTNVIIRKKENQIFLNMCKKIKIKIFRIFDKNYVYVKCNGCKKIFKLASPIKRGIKNVKCPHCNKCLKKLILKKAKVNVIRKEEK